MSSSTQHRQRVLGYINAQQGYNQNLKQNINISNREKVLNNDIPYLKEGFAIPFLFKVLLSHFCM